MNGTGNFRDIEFFDRENETKQIMDVLKVKPQLLNFIYGPINSGKTTLITTLIENLPGGYVVFYINLRGKSIIKYRDFIRVLFTIEEKGLLKKIKGLFKGLLKHITSAGEKTLYKSHGIPVGESLLETFFKEKSHEDVFVYLEGYFKTIAKHKTPVLIIDELQTIGDLKINGHFIYKLFNFFIRLTKELHICHVFALSSDSLFIEKVYNEAMLEGRANYILVDDFDEQTTKKFLEKFKFGDIDTAIKYFGGKPGDLRILLEEGKEINSVVQEKIAEKRRLISDMLDKLLYVKPKIEMEEGEEKIPVERDKVIEILKMFKDKEEIRDAGISRAEKIYLSGKNILFINPQKETIKIQSGIILTGIREILKELK